MTDIRKMITQRKNGATLAQRMAKAEITEWDMSIGRRFCLEHEGYKLTGGISDGKIIDFMISNAIGNGHFGYCWKDYLEYGGYTSLPESPEYTEENILKMYEDMMHGRNFVEEEILTDIEDHLLEEAGL